MFLLRLRYGKINTKQSNTYKYIQVCHRAGIAVHMLTGDHPVTAKAISKEIGIFVKEMPQTQIDKLIMTGPTFNKV